jgi:cell division septum initiation protein DivIVA
MKKIENANDLKERIKLLEAQVQRKETFIKSSAVDLYESMQPINIIKNKINELTNSNISDNKVLQTGLSLGAGFILDKVLLGGKRNFAKNISSYLLTFLSSKLIIDNADKMLGKVDDFIKMVREKRKEKNID